MGSTLRFPADLKAEADAYAASLGISFNALCAVAVRDYLDVRLGPVASAEPSERAAMRTGRSLQVRTPGQPVPSVSEPQAVQAPSSPSQSVVGSERRVVAGKVVPKVGANQPCPCGSGKRYKQCHGRP